MRAVESRKRIIVPSPAASSRFKGFKPESEQKTRQPEVVENGALEGFRRAWIDSGWRSPDGHNEYEINSERLYRIGELLREVSYSAKDVDSFSIGLVEFQDDPMFYFDPSFFFSVMINNGKDREYTIHTSHLHNVPSGLGYMNTKDIIIRGDCGHAVGKQMVCGSIIVDGNAGQNVGMEMRDGTITVKGDADNFVGASMRGGHIIIGGNASTSIGHMMEGGRIVVHGNGGSAVGWDMKGGEIVIHGDAAGSLGETMKGGSITVKGNAGDSVGEHMWGGSIIVEGDAGKDIGHNMNDGVIHIEGDFEGLADNIKGGKIFHKGIRIWPKIHDSS